jgi:hypothetical protein
LSAISFEPFDSNSLARLHIERLNPELALRIEKAIATAVSQREAIRLVLTEGHGSFVHVPIDDPTHAIEDLLATLDGDVERIQSTDDATVLKSLEAEHVELRTGNS